MADRYVSDSQSAKAARRLKVFLVLAALLAAVSLLSPLLVLHDPNQTSALLRQAAPSLEYPFGTDSLGRCVYSRVLAGAPTSIFSSLALVFVSFAVGSALGILCGYYGGVLDSLVMRGADVLLAFPQMVLAIAVTGILGGSLLNAMFALGLTGWTLYARLARSHTLALKNEPFVAACRLSGCSDLRLLTRHIFPNIAGPLLVNATTQIGTTMIGLAGLSFLGLGVTPPQAEWGSMISEARGALQLAPWAALAPSAAMIVTVMVFNELGDLARDWADRSGS